QIMARPQYADEAEGRAVALRDELGLGSEAIGDVFELLNDIGLDVLRWPMGNEGLDGCYIQDGKLALIAVNSDKRLVRQRFTACHELGHHLIDRVSHLDYDIWDSASVPERRANAFAAHFLLPRAGLSRWRRKHSQSCTRPSKPVAADVVHLARHFGTSYRATLYHLRDLGW